MIPIVDFSPAIRNEPRDSEGYQRLVEEIHGAFTDIGFVYIKNHGISQEKIDQYFELSMQFFNQQFETKNKYARSEGFHGYIHQERERLNSKSDKTAVGDLNESYNYVPWNPKIVEFPKFDEANSDMFNDLGKLVEQILEVMGRGMKLDDPFHFIKASQKVGSHGNETLLRSIYYPPPVKIHKQGQLRLGEHTDFGSITILFQDNTGGLEVMNRDGQYVQAIPIDGTALINIGNLMQRWTSDKLVSGCHRILIPDTEEKQKSFRQSLAFFSKPDNESVISCLDHNNKYPPIKTQDYMLSQAKLIYPDSI